MSKRIILGLAGFGAAMALWLSSSDGQTLNRRPRHPPAITNFIRPHLQPLFGDPLFNLSEADLQNFNLGKAQFDGPEEVDEGLGPIFNAQSCNACHSQPLTNTGPTSGGASAITETRFMTAAKVFDLLHQSSIVPTVDNGGTNLFVQDILPTDATQVAHRKTTPLFGLGLVDGIPDGDIIANAKIPKGDGVTGRVATLNDPLTNQIGTNHVGRFGWKDQQATLEAFSGDAYANEMGIANRLFPIDFAPHSNKTAADNQKALELAEPPGLSTTGNQDPPDPITNKDDVERFKDFMQFLAPPPPLPMNRAAIAGQDLFIKVNCVACHTPSFKTGPSAIPPLNFKNVPLYSDLLLHDMGSLGDGIAQAAAGPNELRSAPLWGLRARSPFLHDGRASTILEAILLHDGEAKVIRDRFAALPDGGKQAIIAFLNSI
jgi:CxxC motif-containing protein (DUF1111 family)